jgi:collagenase-like PrtC family protease
VKDSFPGLHVHISTQAGVMNSEHANLFKDADRINLARELSKENVKAIRDKFSKEIEIFCHGALCVCVSGSCLFSSLLGGSGNRGRCAQPCRKLYDGSYKLSTKELCLIDKLPEIAQMGVNSIKIEGRMRTPYYVHTVTSVYRKALDMLYAGRFEVTEEMREKLRSAFSRDFTEGKFSGKDVFNTQKACGTSDVREEFYEPKMKDISLESRKSKLNVPELKDRQSVGKMLIARVYNKQDALAANKYANILCLDMFHKDFTDIKNAIEGPIYAVTPRIMFDSDLKTVRDRLAEIRPQES